MEMSCLKATKKKGLTINDMYPVILTIFMIGMVLGIGLYAMVLMRRSIQSENSGLLNAINASASSRTTTVNGSLASLYIDPDSVTVTNELNSTAYTNYTLQPETGVFVWGGNIGDGKSTDNINLTYTYYYDIDNPEKAITTAVDGTDDFADWIAIIVVVLAAAIILGIVMRSFGRKPGV